jgi:hypothetical protein
MVAIDAYDMHPVSAIVGTLPPADSFLVRDLTVGSRYLPISGNWMLMQVQCMGSANPNCELKVQNDLPMSVWMIARALEWLDSTGV